MTKHHLNLTYHISFSSSLIALYPKINLGVVLYRIHMKKSIFMCRRSDFIEFLGELPLSYKIKLTSNLLKFYFCIMYIIVQLIKCTFSRNCFHTSNPISLRDMIKNVPKFGQNIDNLLLCKQRIQETWKLYVCWHPLKYFVTFCCITEYIGRVQQEVCHHACLNEELGNKSYGIPAIRHRKQQVHLGGTWYAFVIRN